MAVTLLLWPSLTGAEPLGADMKTTPDPVTDLFVAPETQAAAIAALEQAGYAFVTEGGRPDSTTIRIERAGRVVISQRGLDFGLIGPQDMTGDGVDNLLLVVAPDFLHEVGLSLLAFGADGLVALPLDAEAQRSLRERLEIGHLREFTDPRDSAGRDWYRDPMDEIDALVIDDLRPYPDQSARLAELGYSLVQEESSLAIVRNGDEIWAVQSWMLSLEGPSDFTRNDWPNLLVHTARGRSFRGTLLLELREDGVTEVWSVDGHASEMQAFEQELSRLMQAGNSLETLSGTPHPGGLQMPDLPFPSGD